METKDLAHFILGILYHNFNSRTVDYAKMCVQDFIGVAIAGSNTKTGEIWKRYFFDNPVRSAFLATCWNSSFSQEEYHAAAAYNAACGHLLDLDDLHNSSISHLAAVTIPAVMALGQKQRCSGKDVLEAIVSGYEAGARVGEAINPEAYWYWHTTGVVGSFSSAAAAGRLLCLNEDQMCNAFGSAGTQSAGLWEFMENGSMSKSLHTANATLCGMRAAELAKLGFTGAHTILEGKKGFVHALNSTGHMDALLAGAGTEPYKILSNSFKPYACCRHTHSSNACVQWMIENYQIAPEKITKVIDHTYQLAIDLADMPSPTTAYSYKFSIQYCIAAMFIYGELSEEVFTQEKTSNPAVIDLMHKVTVLQDSCIQKTFDQNPNQWPHLLEVFLEDGKVYSHRVDFPPGDFMNPFSWKDADEKFLRVTNGMIPEAKVRSLMNQIRTLETIPDVNQLFDPS